jgi:class 3 adenylate cyclase
MLRAIRDLGNVSAAVTAPSEPVATEPIRRDDAERRQLTVMFTDLVGSTALSTKVDPEDLRSVIGAYHKCVAKTVARFEGFVAKYMGDGVLIYFGYPHAHEDDAERAVRAGLALIDRRASPLDKRHQGAARRGGMMQFIAGELFSISVAASVDDPADVFGTGEHLAASPCNRSHNSGRGMTVRYRDQI